MRRLEEKSQWARHDARGFEPIHKIHSEQGKLSAACAKEVARNGQLSFFAALTTAMTAVTEATSNSGLD
jgi:hypothetical protein